MISRAVKLDPNLEIGFGGQGTSSDSDGGNSFGEPWQDRSLLLIHEKSDYVVYDSCFHEPFIFCIKCRNQISSNLQECGYTGN